MSLETFNAHPATVVVIAGAVMVTPLYALATYVFSGSSARKGMIIGTAFLAFGALMSGVCLADVPARLGAGGGAIVGASWIIPSAVLIAFRRWFVPEQLSQRWLIGLQLWRVIGAVFLLEYARGHIPPAFAYPAGLGDIAVALLAGGVLIAARNRPAIERRSIIAVLVLGVADFASAFFFGNSASPGPFQLFESDITNLVLRYPTGMIPLFLVPYAIFFHTLSLLSMRSDPGLTPPTARHHPARLPATPA